MELAVSKPRTRFLSLGLIIVTQIIVLLLAPEEGTLGQGIKPVYLHVSLTWAGMLLFYMTAVLGLVLIFWRNEKLFFWLRMVFSIAYGMYLMGFLVSLLASYINWGGIPIMEPRIRTASNVLAVATIAFVISTWLNKRGLIGAVSITPAVFMVFTVSSSTLALHPENPVNTSPLGIKYTFYIMFFLAVMLAGWWIAHLYQKEIKR
jgi:hypothetical protein